MSKERVIENIKYTIGFCIIPSENKVLMLFRSNSPNKNKWNGLGGKIDYARGETHQECIIREIYEETDGLVDLNKAEETKYCGVVTWEVTRGSEQYEGGMHAYITVFESDSVMFERKETREGTLDWLKLDEVIHSNNNAMVENISYFLPLMQSANAPARYHCTYVEDELVNFEVLKL